MNLFIFSILWLLNSFEIANSVRVVYEETYPVLKPEALREFKIKKLLSLNNSSDPKNGKDNQFSEILKVYTSVKLESIKSLNVSSVCLGQIENLLRNFYLALNQTDDSVNKYWSLKGFKFFYFQIFFRYS